MAAVCVWGVVLAAGSGQRFGAPKQFARLAGRRLWEWSVGAVAPVCEGVVLVLPPDHADDPAPPATVVAGGATRSQSVRAGLAAVPVDADVVVVHDAAHPLAGPELAREVVAAVAAGAEGAVALVPVTETFVELSEPGVVGATTPAGGRHLLQLPTAFAATALRAVHADAPEATDEASLLVAAGYRVVGVAGQLSNVHVTTAAELELAAHLLASRQEIHGS